MFAPLLVSMASEYNNALLVIENNHDYGVLNKIEELGYDNIYYSLKSTHEYVDQATAEARGGVAGFTMSMKTRPLVLSKLEEFIRNKLLILNSLRTVNEIKTFIWHNGRPQGMRGYNDDLVIALAIACWIRDTALTVNQKEVEQRKAMFTGWRSDSSKLDTRIQGMTGYSERKQKPKPGGNYLPWIYKG